MKLSYREHGTTDWHELQYTPTNIDFTVTDPADFLIKISLIESNGASIFKAAMQATTLDFRMVIDGVTFYTTTETTEVTHVATDFKFSGKLNNESIFLYSICFIAV